jgi:hypothetical protein
MYESLQVVLLDLKSSNLSPVNAFMNYAYKFSFLPRTITDWNSLHPEAYRATTPESFKEIIQRLQT